MMTDSDVRPDEDGVRAVQGALGLRNGPPADLARLRRSVPEIKRACQRLAKVLFGGAVRRRLERAGLDTGRDAQPVDPVEIGVLDSFWEAVEAWATRSSESGREAWLAEQIRAALQAPPDHPSPGPRSAEAAVMVQGQGNLANTESIAQPRVPVQSSSTNPRLNVGDGSAEPGRDQPTPPSQGPRAEDPGPSGPTCEYRPSAPQSKDRAASSPSPTPPATPPERRPDPVPIGPLWKYKPIPEGEPEPHPEYFHKADRSPEGLTLLGARVRGKKHKHDGTNCDDWFEFDIRGKWTMMAVADGGGAYRFSRLGSRAAAETAVRTLAEELKDHVILPRDRFTKEDSTELEFRTISFALEKAMREACRAVDGLADAHADNATFRAVLGRPPRTKDFYTTLLLAAHTTVRDRDGEKSLVYGCAVGDGMIAAVGRDGVSSLLMIPDSGDHSGEVRFLEEAEVRPDRLRGKIMPFVGTIRALMLMTDGVADDYFPNDPRMSWLYGDLVLNGIIPAAVPTNQELAAAMAATGRYSLAEIVPDRASAEVETIGVDLPPRVKVRSLGAFARDLESTEKEVVASPALLWAGSRGEPIADSADPSERLRVWLDSYHVRGSFDDRTLVILHR